MSVNDPLFVVAYDYPAYLRWCEQKGHPPTGGAYRYVRGVETLRPLRSPVRFLFLKGWDGRRDWRKIYNRSLVIGRRPS